MRIGGRIGTGVLVLGLVFATAPAANAASPRAANAGTGTDTITLITGDQVTVRGGTAVSVRPGPGREKVTFSRFSAGGHLFVLPDDARRLVATGLLDQRLFDLTTLREFGYDDAHSDTVPLIVTHQEGRAAPRAGRVGRELPSIDGVATTVDKAEAGAAWEALTDGTTTRTMAEGVTAVWLDGKRRSTLDQSAVQIGAPAAWDAGVTGSGVTVAVLDTGVDQTHPDLADREVAERNFSDAPDNVDNAGHGTHVASILAGTGARSGGKYRGIAHGASILDGKVLDDGGFGLDSWIIAGMEWAAEQGADIANLSLGGFDTTAVDPLEQAVESLTDEYGTLFVIAAGNSGPGEHSVGSPGTAPSALTVGAVNRDDTLAEFSSRGPTEEPGVIKPDITAPGVGIVAALHSAGTIGDPVVDGYTALTGTSMAAPHVAGAAALIAQLHPDWTGQQVKAALTAAAEPAPGVGVYDQGAGRVDVAHALTQTIVTEPAVVHVGIAAWPHDDDEPLSRTVTYRNLGETDATLDLAVSGTGPDGAPADVFSLSTDEITVPAGGEESVTVTGDTDRGGVDGHYSGTITATGGGSVTRTPVVVTREVESYDLTFDYVDENGAPTSEYSTFLVGIDSGRVVVPYDEDGSETVRLPKGRYFADHLMVPGQEGRVHAILHPGILLDRDLRLDVDASATRPVEVTPPVSATLGLAEVGYLFQVDGAPFIAAGFAVDVPGTLYSAQVGEPLPGTAMSGWVSTHWAGEDGAYYGLAWALDEFPTGYTRDVERGELARLRVELGAGLEGGSAMRSKTPLPAPGVVPAFEYGYDVSLPGTRTEYVTTEDLTWRSSLWQYTAEDELVLLLDTPWRSYQPGRTYRASMNKPVFGPGLPPAAFPWASRLDDAIEVYLPLFTDGHDNASTAFATESGSTRLYRGDQLVGESAEPGYGYFPDLPAEPARYRLTTEATRAHFDVSTKISAEWTFMSSTVDGSAALELNVVRFTPKVAPDGSAPASRPFRVPVRVQDESGATVRPTRITVEASYDKGATWRRVPVGHDLLATLHHPADATSVSLRASATDRDGNTVRQTVLRAYTLR
ncbi:S8 family serine peptidase [Actinophytocola xanthii]|uniref:Peptidase S8/S53 domain-containing protein n=1 Tax=Actinophytocola xanthii TaxID=1912961 RepID=A0A1Q8BVF9_9PSEU|nr:S8 family serine peptidase [Actinophytocola xanthii]OLF06098.1 hypothetical protein BU204_36605 [Actinophytocola xanthii]